MIFPQTHTPQTDAGPVSGLITQGGPASVSTTYQILIWGVPIAKKRPRFARRGEFTTTYNPQQTEEGRVLWEVKNQWSRPPLEGPIIAGFSFGMPIPKSTSKKRARLMVLNEIKHTKKPDLDNFLKFYKDVLNSVVWRDDSQVFRLLESSKFYAENPFTLIKVKEVF